MNLHNYEQEFLCILKYLENFYKNQPLPIRLIDNKAVCSSCGSILGDKMEIGAKFKHGWVLECPGCEQLCTEARKVLKQSSDRRWSTR